MKIKGEYLEKQELADSLKLDASILTPKGIEWFRLVGGEFRGKIEGKYGKYIPQDTLERNQRIEDRIVVIEKEDIREVCMGITGLPESLFKLVGDAIYFQEEGMLILSTDNQKYWNFFDEAQKSQFIEKLGSEEKAKEMVNIGFLLNFLTHEIIHSYHDDNLPVAFRECAVPYYEKEVFGQVILQEYTEKKDNFYRNLVEKYGDEVHGFFFGGKIDPKKRSAILTEIDEHITDLFSENEIKLYGLE